MEDTVRRHLSLVTLTPVDSFQIKCEFWEILGKVNEATNKREFLKQMYLSPGQKIAPAETKKK